MNRRIWIFYYLLVIGAVAVFFALFEPEYFWAAMLCMLILLAVEYFILSRFT